MSVRSDGSQPLKTDSEKELVLVRTTKAGLPIYFVVSLLEMAEFGGTDAESLKNAVDSVFEKKGNHPTLTTLHDYLTKMISTKANGANISMGKYNSTLTMMATERSWLMVIHCMNHHIELAIKDMVKSVNKFEECNKFYNTIFNLFKNLGKLKSATKEACTASNIMLFLVKAQDLKQKPKLKGY